MTTLTQAAPLPATRPAGFDGALRSEWTKLRTVRSTPGSLFAMAAISIGLMALIAWLRVGQRWDRLDPAERTNLAHHPLQLILSRPEFLSQLVVAVLGVLVISAEYSTGMIRSTLQSQPRRLTIFGAKIVVLAAVMLVVGEVIAFAAFYVGRQIIARHITVNLSDPGVTRAVIGLGLFLAVLGLFSLAFGAMLRHTAGAITAVIGLNLIISPLTQLLPDSWGQHVYAWMPVNAGVLILQPQQGPGDLLSPWQGFAVFGGWTVLLLIVAAVMFQRRDA
jgi:ABC-type transport system involved in multi-copper enzyme maturation permease subunit